MGAVPLVDVWRGEFQESHHRGHAVICDSTGQIVDAWGDPDAVILPRSAIKMIQALPLLESGAADAYGLTDRQLALACASHSGAAIHTEAVEAWLSDLGLSDDDLRCGAHFPTQESVRNAMIRADEKPCQRHNNCSGKHTGFLTLNKHLKTGSEYVDPDHPVQRACLSAYEETTQETSPGFGIDGCSAPNFAASVNGVARAMAFFAQAREDGDRREKAARRLWQAMVTHPELVAGEERACTKLMHACSEPVAIKTGAEGVFIAILPERGLGITLKVEDGATRASECAISALLVRLGVLDKSHPTAQAYLKLPLRNHRNLEVGKITPSASFV